MRRGVPKSMIESRQLSQQGVSAIERKNYNEAERLLAQAVQTCGADPEARRYYAEALWQNGSRQEAMKQLQEAALLCPSDPLVRRRMAEYELELGNLERATALADEGLGLAPQDPASWVMRAKVRERAGQLDLALADYQRAMGLDPEQPEVMLVVAELHRQRNQPERAMAALQSVRESYAPGEEPPRVYYLMGLAAGALGRPDEALANYQLARERGDRSPELLLALAQAQWSTGQPIQAEQTAGELIARSPDYEPGRRFIEQIRSARAAESMLR